ncbi:MAG TPA: hypothetical protein VEI25_05725, partial [Paraburkholderia sp.]|nr:hypothetical protein [Paraburkholderia sp.]
MASEQGWKQANRDSSSKKREESNLICGSRRAWSGQRTAAGVPAAAGATLSGPTGGREGKRLVRTDHKMIDQLNVDQR